VFENVLYNLQALKVLQVNFHYFESPFSEFLHVCDKLNQLLDQNPLDEILIRVNDWLYHCMWLHEQFVAMIFHLEDKLQ
jgi:hypothetical protein